MAEAPRTEKDSMGEMEVPAEETHNGVHIHRGNPNFINLRHGGQSSTNVLRADGSASSVPEADVDFAAMDEATLAPFYPPLKWRMDQ